jgi:hypothetical protein
MTNALAYLASSAATKEESFITLTPGQLSSKKQFDQLNRGWFRHMWFKLLEKEASIYLTMTF